MRSQLFSIGVITIAMLLSMCQLAIPSPARLRSQVEIGDEEEVISNNVHITEDPIINEVPTDTKERMELNPRPKPIQRISITNVTAANNREIETMTLKPNIMDGSLNTNDSISELENASAAETIGQEGGTNGNTTNDQILIEALKEMTDGVEDNQPPKAVPQNEPLEPRLHGVEISSNMMDKQNNESINEQVNESTNVQSSLNRNLETIAEPNADLMGQNETDLPSKITAETGESFHTHSNVGSPNVSIVVNQSETENHRNVENDDQDRFLMKHNHLAQLLFHSSFLNPLSQPNKNLSENPDKINSEMGVENLARMITEPDVMVEMREDKNDGFQERSDVNLTAGSSENNNDQPIDRSLEIDASHLAEDINFEERTKDEDIRDFPPTPTENITEQESPNTAEENDDKSKGFLAFLRSLFF